MNCKVIVKSMKKVTDYESLSTSRSIVGIRGPEKKYQVSASVYIENGTEVEGDFTFENGTVNSFTEAEEEIKKLFTNSEEV